MKIEEMPARRLLIDTAGPVVGVAGWVGEGLVASAESRIVQGADGWLTPAVGAVLEALGGLDCVGVTVGPGAFTGLRVGVATALGLALARGVPVVCVSSLALRAAWGAMQLGPGRPAQILALLDAKKGRVYAGRFLLGSGPPLADGPEGDVLPGAALAGLAGFVVGEGAVRYAVEAEALGWTLVPRADASPVTGGLELLTAGRPQLPERVVCEYLRGADAVPPKR